MKATFSQASTHRCDSENASILSLRLHVAYLSLTQCSLATLSRKLPLSIGKSIRLANSILKLQTQPHSCTQYHSHSAGIAFGHTRTQPRPLSSAKLALSNTRTQAHSRSSTLALSQTRTQQHWHSAALSLSRTRTQAHSHSAKVALSNTRTQPHSHSGALALRHTRSQPHSHFRIYFVVTIAALIMLVAVFLSVYFLRLSTSTQVQVSPASKQKSLY